MSGFLRDNSCKICRNIPLKRAMKEFTENNFFNKADAFAESLQQLLISTIKYLIKLQQTFGLLCLNL